MTRERGSMQPGVRRLVQPRGSGRGSKGWARQEAGGKAAAEVSLLLMKILRRRESSTLRGVWGNLGVAQNNELL